jgi:hypothetical protein
MANLPTNPKQFTSSVEADGSTPSHCGSETSGNKYDTLASLGAELLRRAAESQPDLEAAWNELMARWEIGGEPAGIERLRARIQEESGPGPQEIAFTRELIALRTDRSS